MDDPMKEIIEKLVPPTPELDGEAAGEAHAVDAKKRCIRPAASTDEAESFETALDEAEENVESEDERDNKDNLGRFSENDYAARIAGWEFKAESVYAEIAGEDREIDVYYRRPQGSAAGTKWERIGHAHSPNALELRRLMRCAKLRDARARDAWGRRAAIERLFGAGSMPLVEALIAAPAEPERGPLNPRQEAFCRHFLTEPSGTRAAIMAGYSARSAENQASRMMRNDEVLQKISALRRAHALSYALDRDTMLDKLEAFFDDAMKGQSFSAALRALLAQAELSGLLTRRHKATQRADARARTASRRAKAPKRAPARKKTGPVQQ
jgi:hypothetical protein